MSRPSIVTARPTRRALSLMLLASSLAACGGDAPKTTALKFRVQADDLINPNVNGDASPVVVRIYELKNTSAFDQASFFDLLDNDSAKLGTDLVAKREVEVKPNDDLQFDRDTPIETRFIGVIAGFRTLDSAKWKSFSPIDPDTLTNVRISLTSQAVAIEILKQRKGFF